MFGLDPQIIPFSGILLLERLEPWARRAAQLLNVALRKRVRPEKFAFLAMPYCSIANVIVARPRGH
jgi:hypothetical protein